jgi:hypothetical protein
MGRRTSCRGLHLSPAAPHAHLGWMQCSVTFKFCGCFRCASLDIHASKLTVPSMRTIFLRRRILFPTTIHILVVLQSRTYLPIDVKHATINLAAWWAASSKNFSRYSPIQLHGETRGHHDGVCSRRRVTEADRPVQLARFRYVTSVNNNLKCCGCFLNSKKLLRYSPAYLHVLVQK